MLWSRPARAVPRVSTWAWENVKLNVLSVRIMLSPRDYSTSRQCCRRKRSIVTGRRTSNTRNKSPRWVASWEVNRVPSPCLDRDKERLARSVSSKYKQLPIRLVSMAAWRTRVNSICKTSKCTNSSSQHPTWNNSNNKLRSSINSKWTQQRKIRTVRHRRQWRQPRQLMARKSSRPSSNRIRQVNSEQSSEAHMHKGSRVAHLQLLIYNRRSMPSQRWNLPC